MTSWGWPKRLKSYLLPAGMLAAGTAALLTGLLPWPAFQDLSARTVPVLTFVVAMSLVTEMVDDAGLFRVVTERLAALGRGRVFLLWLLVIGLAVVSTVFLSPDTTAVLVTPVVVLLAIHARIPPLPFALTTVSSSGAAARLQLAGPGAGAANAVNNLPAYLALEPVGDSPVRLAALLIGVNLGPLVTPWASLATLLWHERLRTLNVEIRWGGFAVAGLAAVVLTVPLAVVALWLTTGMH